MSATSAAIVVLIACAVAIAILGTRAFAFLGGVVDTWRPTAEDQARPGHEHLGIGLLFVAAPLWLIASSNVPETVTRFWRQQALLPLGWTFLVLVLLPIMGVLIITRWKNRRLNFDGDKISEVDVLGRPVPAVRVISAKMYPQVRGAARVGFEVSDGWIVADTSWTNIRPMYEKLAKLGVKAEPWLERPRRWSDVWG